MIRPIQWRLRPHCPGVPSREAPRVVVIVPDAGDRGVMQEVLDSIRRQRDIQFEAVALTESDPARGPYAATDPHEAIAFFPIGLVHGLPTLYNLLLADTRADCVFTLPPGAAFATEHGLARMVEALDAEPTAALALTAASRTPLPAPGAPPATQSTPRRASSCRRSEPPNLFISLMRGSYALRLGVLARCAAIRALGGLDPRFPTTGERLLWLRLLLTHDALRVREPILTRMMSAASALDLPASGPASEELAMLHELKSFAPPDPRVSHAIGRAIDRWIRHRAHSTPGQPWSRPRSAVPGYRRAPRVLVHGSGNA